MEIVNEWFPTEIFRNVDTNFSTEYTYEKELMAELTLKRNTFHKAGMEYHGKFVHTIARVKHIALMSRLDICYANCRLATQTASPTLTGLQGIKCFVQYLDSHPHKPIFYPTNYYDGSNFIILLWSGNQVEYYTTQNCLEYHQDADQDRFLIRRRAFSGILHTMVGVAAYLKV